MLKSDVQNLMNVCVTLLQVVKLGTRHKKLKINTSLNTSYRSELV
jgi:hypothetical protein